MKPIHLIYLLSILLASCHQGQLDKASFEGRELGDYNAPATQQATQPTSSPVEKLEKTTVNKKKIIKDGRLGLQVENLKKTKQYIDSLVKNLGGYYANERYNNSDWESSYDLTIRIPSKNFEQFLSKVESGKDKTLYKELHARDVTDQFIDLESRLANKQNYLKRYNDLLGKANSIKEILEIEEKIRRLEEEIESVTGRLQYLNNQVDYSTLDLNISKRKEFKYTSEKRSRFAERFKQSLSKGWFGFIDFFLFVIRLWPFWALVALSLYFWKRSRRKSKKR